MSMMKVIFKWKEDQQNKTDTITTLEEFHRVFVEFSKKHTEEAEGILSNIYIRSAVAS